MHPMTRERAIQIISDLYPADSEHQDTAAIGRQLLKQAKAEVEGWRAQPTDVLIRYAELCVLQEQSETTLAMQKQYAPGV